MDYPRDPITTEPTVPTRPRRKRTRPSPWTKPLSFLLVLVLWGGLVYGGCYYAKQYIDRTIQDVQQTNAMNVRAIKDRLDTLAAKIQEIEDVLQQADQTLASSGSTQKELNKKIAELDRQLQELEKSLNILKEAP
ncbi:MAG: hypothetical protein H0Z39_09900 [Peptococcaceae bacterium]|nr:hypothetical protein [Peptococcaceae bacterium]